MIILIYINIVEVFVLTLNFIQQISLKIFLFIMSVIYSVSGAVIPPSTETPIDAKNPDEANLVFAALADPQISNYMFDRYEVFEAVSMDIKNSAYDLDALLIAGDVAENGLAEEYQLIYNGISGIEGCRYLMATGNHDIRLRLYSQSVKRFSAFANALNGDEAMTSLHYSETINGYKFIVLGSDKTEFEEAYLSPEQLSWLDSELASVNGEPVFVICHQPLKGTHGLPTTWGNGTNENAGHIGDQNDELKAILTKHENVILVSGHLHTAFGEYTYQYTDGIHMVNLPSLCIENKDGDYNEAGLGYIVEAYDDEIIFRARDLKKGIWLPEYDITIPVA